MKTNKNDLFYGIIVKYERGRIMDIKVKDEYITLGQLLKVANIVQTGGEAKFAVKSLPIQVNGEKEDRRGRKLYPNDQIIVEDVNEVVTINIK